MPSIPKTLLALGTLTASLLFLAQPADTYRLKTLRKLPCRRRSLGGGSSGGHQDHSGDDRNTLSIPVNIYLTAYPTSGNTWDIVLGPRENATEGLLEDGYHKFHFGGDETYYGLKLAESRGTAGMYNLLGDTFPVSVPMNWNRMDACHNRARFWYPWPQLDR